MICPAMASNENVRLTCGMDADHHPPHFDPVLKVWWAIPRDQMAMVADRHE